MAVKISQALQQQIFVQMERTFPNEGGGFLFGSKNGDDTVIEEVIQIENVFETEEQYHRYAMTPQNWANMEDAADERDLQLVGYYHSHPNHPAIPSEFDRVHALPNFIYIITSVIDGQSNVQLAWLLSEDRRKFNKLDLVLE